MRMRVTRHWQPSLSNNTQQQQQLFAAAVDDNKKTASLRQMHENTSARQGTKNNLMTPPRTHARTQATQRDAHNCAESQQQLMTRQKMQ